MKQVARDIAQDVAFQLEWSASAERREGIIQLAQFIRRSLHRTAVLKDTEVDEWSKLAGLAATQ